MPRWLWWAPLAILTVWAALALFRAGWVVARITETDVILHYANRYAIEGGKEAKITDCSATPSADPAIWLVIRCGRDTFYPVDRFGRLVLPRRDPTAPKL